MSDLTEEAIFRRALMIPAMKQRVRFLDHTCGEDSVLRDRLGKLLEADETEWKQFDSLLENRTTSEEVIDPIPSIENYQLLEKIGAGGMADVFAAEQLTPFRRQVAVKVQRTKQFDSEAFHRFEAEQQTLAKLKHENIATIYDAGITTDGAPYVSMELLRGEPITTYCNDHRLKIEDRLRILLDACNGIEYAHHHGVIHRDLKPANILITETVRGPQPKIIDFGIAKNTEESHRYKETQDGIMLGTLDYMSPEQVHHDSSKVDAHSDIFSLGVILHEMLVGELPLEKELRRTKTLEERLKCMRTAVPAPISRTLMSLQNSPQLAENRSSSFEDLKRLFTPALDLIVSRMVAKRPQDRYATVQQVATDLERILERMHFEKKRKLKTSSKVSQKLFHPAMLCFVSFLFLFSLFTVFRSGQTHSEPKLKRHEPSRQEAAKQGANASATATSQLTDLDSLRNEPLNVSVSHNENASLPDKTASKIEEFYYRIHGRRPVSAFQLAKSWPADPQLEKRRQQLIVDVPFTEVPPHAEVEICDWIKEPFEWHRIEITNGVAKLPLGIVFIEPLKRFYARSFRIRIRCSGYLSREFLLNQAELKAIGGEIRLVKRTEDMPDDMTLVNAVSSPNNTSLKRQPFILPPQPPFWMDPYEVSNEEYLEFVEAGAYERPEFWTSSSFLLNGEELSFDAAMKRFVDRSGRPGPASWNDGRFAIGMEKHPVSGISFFEASAYALYRGKCLPTSAQWHQAASGQTTAAIMVTRNNFASNGPARCGAHSGISQFNIRDLGGNVREWCDTGDQSGNSYILGGSWESPPSAIHLKIAANRWDRSEVNGIRCCKSIRGDKPKQTKQANADIFSFPTQANPKHALTPLTELRARYEYDRATPTAATGNQIANATFASLGMSHTIAQIQSAYDPSRYNLHIFAPTRHKRPLGCVIVLPDSIEGSQTGDTLAQTFANPESLSVTADILSRYNLLLCAPDFKHRVFIEEPNNPANNFENVITRHGLRNTAVNSVKDTMRALDYLLARADVNADQCFVLAFGKSGPRAIRLLALDDRFQSGVLVATGYGKRSRVGRGMGPHPHNTNAAYEYVPYVKQPILMINGSRDLAYPETLAQIPLYQELGSTLKKKIKLGNNLLDEPQHLGAVMLHAADWFQQQPKAR